MSELNHALIDALFLVAQEEESTASLERIRNAAFQKLEKGEVKSLVSTSLNGKSYSYNLARPADELFAAVSLAIRKYNRGLITSTEVDFSNI